MLTFIPASFLLGQSIDLQVFSAAGSHAETTAGSLEWSLGEMRASDHSNNGLRLADGFHQIVTWNLVSTEESTSGDAFQVTVSAYPVPAIYYLRVESSHTVYVQLLDINGVKVIETTLINQTGELDLSALPAGIYFLQAQDGKGCPLKTLKIQHIQ